MLYKLVTFSLLFLCPGILFAEFTLTGNLLTSPEYPKAYDSVTVTLESYSFDPNTTLITWRQNGKTILSGVGEKSLRITLGPNGRRDTFTVNAKTPSGQEYNDAITLTPSTATLVWETLGGYVPPFYKGKILPAEGSTLRVTAFPSFSVPGGLIAPKSLTYVWSMNSEHVEAASGFGKNTFTTKLNYLENENEVKVVASTIDGSQAAEKRVTILPAEIVGRFYIADPIFGTRYESALMGSAEINKETTFVFEPYFIGVTNLSSPSLTSDWILNGLPVNPNDANSITIRPKPESKGIGTLEVDMEQTKKFLQKVGLHLQVVFDTTK
jgi:hypothetical protein